MFRFHAVLLLSMITASSCGDADRGFHDLLLQDVTGAEGDLSEPSDDVALSDTDEPTLRFLTSPYVPGPFTVVKVSYEHWDTSADVPFDGYVPDGDGPFPVVLFLHGFLADKALYSGLLTHVASHGFVVLAPQDYPADDNPFGKPTAVEEAAVVRQFLAWAPDNVPKLLDVDCDFERLGLAGHSRGGKVAWLLLVDDPATAQAVAGVDPVDGTGGPLGGEERVVQGPFDLPIPSLVLGTELGPQVADGPFAAACAPQGDNHEQFYAASAPPAWHILALEHGHNDMMDLADCDLFCAVCPTGPDPAGMQRLVAGSMVAFFAHALLDYPDAASYLDEAEFPIAATLTEKF